MILDRVCRYSGFVCHRSSCSIFDCASGNVGVCLRHLNPSGFLVPRRVSGSGLSLLQIWSLKR